jgi:ketosteroid isomerase-like protein
MFGSIFRLVSLSAFLLAGGACVSSPGSGPTSALALAEREVRALDQARRDALRENDLRALEAIYDDNFVMVTATGEIRSKRDQLNGFGSGAVTHQGPEPRILSLRAYPDCVIVISESDEGWLVIDGQADAGKRRYTRIYVRKGGHWKLASTHISNVSGNPK